MARILITGSAQGLGRAAAAALLDDGHQVVVHARDTHRAPALRDLADRGAAVVVGDLASAQQTRSLADQVNQLGRMDTIIHNAGVYGDAGPNRSPEGHPRVLAVNTLAPYLLTGLIQGPNRLIYLTSDMHVSGDQSLHDLDWTTRRWNGTQAYCDSKLFVTALSLGAHPHGRPVCHRRPRPRPPYSDMARCQRQSRRQAHRFGLAPPPTSTGRRGSPGLQLPRPTPQRVGQNNGD
ncbi:SDR family NAD(P)-dependent oxidoreductase [Arthrobacter sp. 2RAF6]|uniref:SDR family NAD(P)-dependent oxidoreductase n=1 Tax=Arthrobacter sp. 2RAF6 TaxID=3233002 RepID=UPI003F8FFA4C